MLASQCRASPDVVLSLPDERPSSQMTMVDRHCRRKRRCTALSPCPITRLQEHQRGLCCVLRHAWSPCRTHNLVEVLSLLNGSTRESGHGSVTSGNSPSMCRAADASIWAAENLMRPDPAAPLHRLASAQSPWRAQVLRQRLLSDEASTIGGGYAGSAPIKTSGPRGLQTTSPGRGGFIPGAFIGEDAPYLEAQGLRGLCADSNPISSLARALLRENRTAPAGGFRTVPELDVVRAHRDV